jgi:ATP-binding protein involved in chromosome partitioning
MSIEQKVRAALDDIRPILQADGGDLELVAIEGRSVHVRLRGACSTCPSATATLRNVVEEKIRERCPEIEQVIDVSARASHAGHHAAHAEQAPAARPPLADVRSIVAVASGKGGVGKSTVAVNLALALARQGLRTGLLDADVYGPSIPTMLGATAEPMAAEEGILPIEHAGLKIMSIGFYLDADTPVIWRGPMVMKAVGQFLQDVVWGELDCMVIDLPPGTGDAQLTVVQAVPVTGALIVTTPSDVALLDARRAIGMFDKVGVPVIGITENMSHFVCPHCGKGTEVFSRGGGARVAEASRVPFLGEIPLDPVICAGGDRGRPVMVDVPDGPQGQAFTALAQKVSLFLDAAAGRAQGALH